MKQPYTPFKQFVFAAAGCLAAILFLFPIDALASEGAPEFFVSAWLVRLWLALVCGTVIVVGVIVAMDGYSAKYTTDPVLTKDRQVVMVKTRKLSYRKVGGGLLCVIVGCALFVTTVFLLPDKRTGHSGIGKIVQHFKSDQMVVEEKPHVESAGH